MSNPPSNYKWVMDNDWVMTFANYAYDYLCYIISCMLRDHDLEGYLGQHGKHTTASGMGPPLHYAGVRHSFAVLLSSMQTEHAAFTLS